MSFTADFAVDRSSRVLVLLSNFPFYGKMNIEVCVGGFFQGNIV